MDAGLGLHISRNETKHVYMESPLEGLIQTFKTMKVEGQDWRKVKLVMMLRMNATKQHELLKQD